MFNELYAAIAFDYIIYSTIYVYIYSDIFSIENCYDIYILEHSLFWMSYLLQDSLMMALSVRLLVNWKNSPLFLPRVWSRHTICETSSLSQLVHYRIRDPSSNSSSTNPTFQRHTCNGYSIWFALQDYPICQRCFRESLQ